MYSLKNTKILKIIACVILFFSFNMKTQAAENYKKHENAIDLYAETCNKNTNCIPICIYNCPDCYYSHAQNNDEYAYIGHFYGEYQRDEDDIRKIWQLGVLHQENIIGSFGAASDLYEWTYDKLMGENEGTFNIIVKNTTQTQGQYQISDDHLEPWRNTDLYNNLYNSLQCPAYYGFINKNYNVFSDRTSSGYPTKALSYSFGNEFENVLTAATPQNITEFTGPMKVKELYMFMEKMAGYTEYNDSLTEEQNSQKLCGFLKNKVGSSKDSVEQFVKDFSKDEEKIKGFIDEKLSASAQSNAIDRFRYIYTYDNLQGVIEGKRIVDSNNVSYFKRINDIYTISERNAISYFNNKCSLGLSEEDLDKIETDTSEKVMEKLDSTTHTLPGIDYDTKFDCSSLFSGEIAKIISGAYFIIEMVALAIFIVMTTLGYIKVIMNGESDEIKKQNQYLIKRIIIIAIIFILPALVNTILNIFKIEGFDSENPLCVRISNK